MEVGLERAAMTRAAAAEVPRCGFADRLAAEGHAPLRRGRLRTLQLNVGRRCDLACHHCHVEAGPKRTEMMDRAGAERVLDLLARSPSIEVLDLTGGAPELNASFRLLVDGARALGRRVIDRCNLTVLLTPGQEGTVEYLAKRRVEVAASLPCSSDDNVDRQRGRGVFARSIEALRLLNRLGYGRPGTGLLLDLVYNPVGAFLPPPQRTLEQRYRTELGERFGIEFTRLVTITNMPIRRFAHDLLRQGKLSEYMSLLVNHFNPATLPSLMCRSLVSVAYDGALYDCDFNQMLEVPIGGRPRSIWDVDDLARLEGEPIEVADHCYGCTAGAGSSCGGALVDVRASPDERAR